jgi:flagellar basal-body rod protein FlgB
VKPIFDTTTDALAASLNFRGLKQNVTASNIANAETPGYHAKKVDFEDTLARAIETQDLGSGDSRAIQRSKADVYDNPEGNVTNDQNSVDLEREMSNLQENTILYKAAMQLMNKKLAAMRYAVTEGGR